MTRFSRFAIALVVMAIAFLTGCSSDAPPSDTDDYLAYVAEQLEQSPVYVDPDAVPSITDEQADRLAQQIIETGKPIYVIMTNSARSLEYSSANAFVTQLDQRHGANTAVYGISDETGFYGQSTGMMTGQMNEVNVSAYERMFEVTTDDGHADAISGWIDDMAAADWYEYDSSWGPLPTIEAAPVDTGSSTWLFVTIPVALILGVAAVFFAFRLRNKRRQAQVQPPVYSKRPAAVRRSPKAHARTSSQEMTAKH